MAFGSALQPFVPLGKKRSKVGSEREHFVNAAVEVPQFRFGNRPHLAAGDAAFVSRAQDASKLAQGEPERERVPDHAHAAHGVGRVLPVSG